MSAPNFEPGDQYDSTHFICPYCGARWQAEAEDCDEDEQEEECSKCGKTYIRWASISVDYHTMQKPEKEKKP